MKSYMRLCLLLLTYLMSLQSLCAEGLRVMTFNIRYDNPSDKPHDWAKRRDSVVALLSDEQADIIGLQEVLHNQLVDLQKRLKHYRSIGVGRLDGATKGEYAPILYNRKRWQATSSGYFWLSATPSVAGSVGWDAACERIATWAILYDRRTRQSVFVINTHLDHVGVVARQKSAELIRAFIKERGVERLPIILMGDFNAEPDDAVVKMMNSKVYSPRLSDSYLGADESSGVAWTFHNFGKLAEAERTRIDYILHSEGLNVERYRTLRTDEGEIHLSDHNAVVVDFELR